MQTYADRAAPIVDSTEYPSSWTAYIGQAQAKTQLQVAAMAAHIEGRPLDHTLIVGGPGIGKTALGVQVAREMRKPIRVMSGYMEADAIRLILLGMDDGDLIFWDEFHGIMAKGRAKAEWFLNYAQDYAIPGPLGLEAMPKVTIIAATSEPQLLLRPIMERFMNKVELDSYTLAEAAKIVTVTSAKVLGANPKVTGKDAIALAAACHHNPRTIKRMLTVLRDVTVTKKIKPTPRGYDIPALLGYQGITADGLGPTHRAYLTRLAEDFGGKAGAKALEDRLVLSEALDLVERPLMDAGYIVRTRSGRTLTAAGMRRYYDLAKEAA